MSDIAVEVIPLPADSAQEKSLRIPPGRLVYLDVLRAVAIVLVLGNHPPRELEPHQFGYSFFSAWQRGGWVGVDLFFVLSGFLIGGILFAEIAQTGKLDVKRFLIRRGFKIWPVYIVFLLINGMHRAIRFPGTFAERITDIMSSFWPNLLHVQNYTGLWGSPFGHTWSLAVEEHFYLALPLLLVFVLKRSPTRFAVLVPGIICLILVICLTARVITALLYPKFNVWVHLTPTHLRLDSLGAGVLLAWLVQRFPDGVNRCSRHAGLFMALGVLCFVPPLFFSREYFFMHTFAYSVQSLGACSIVLWALIRSKSVGLSEHWRKRIFVRSLAYIGTFSYSIYLWHIPYGQAVALRLYRGHGSQYDYAITMLAFVIGAVTSGVVSYKLIESPFLSLRNVCFPRPKSLEDKVIVSNRSSVLTGEAGKHIQ